MEHNKLEHTNWKSLADAMAATGEKPQVGWSEGDLAQMLRHQLDLPAGAGFGDWTIGRLLCDPHPRPDGLQWLKSLAKASADTAEGPPPQEISAVLYFGSIAASIVRCQRSISKLDAPRIIEGLSWVLQQGWLDAPTRESFEQLRTGLKSRIPR